MLAGRLPPSVLMFSLRGAGCWTGCWDVGLDAGQEAGLWTPGGGKPGWMRGLEAGQDAGFWTWEAGASSRTAGGRRQTARGPAFWRLAIGAEAEVGEGGGSGGKRAGSHARQSSRVSTAFHRREPEGEAAILRVPTL